MGARISNHEIKTIITRVGENTKIVFTGDPQQIDTPYLDAKSDGLSYLIEKFKVKNFLLMLLWRKERGRHLQSSVIVELLNKLSFTNEYIYIIMQKLGKKEQKCEKFTKKK